MRKSEITGMIKEIAIELIECKYAMNDEEKDIARKISMQDSFDFSSLSAEEVEYISSFLCYSSNCSIKQLDDCVEFLLGERHK